MSSYFIADDLSGALDAAAAFHRTGQRVKIASCRAGSPNPAATPDAFREVEDTTAVVGLTTETRNADAATAGEIVRATITALTAAGGTLVYKKIDSTLRGQLAAELAAVLDVLPGTRILLAPANPAVGRTTREGVLYVNGQPVHQTPFGQDPKSPLRSSRIADLLGGLAAQHDIVIPDIESADDFVRAVAAMDAAGHPWLAVGSGGLVHALAGRTGGTESPGYQDRGSPGTPLPGLTAPILLLAGSAHPLNRTQIDALIDARPVDRLLLDPSLREEGGASARPSSDHSLVLQLPTERLDPAQALDTLITAAVAHLACTGTRRVFATGGETAFALCDRLGIRSLEYIAELEPGLALARASTPTGPLHLAVKPGGFGDAQTWIRAFDALRFQSS